MRILYVCRPPFPDTGGERPFLDRTLLRHHPELHPYPHQCVPLLLPASTRERSPRCSSCSSPAPSVVLQSPATISGNPLCCAREGGIANTSPGYGCFDPASSLQRQLQIQPIRLELATLAYSTMPLFGKSSLYAEIVGWCRPRIYQSITLQAPNAMPAHPG